MQIAKDLALLFVLQPSATIYNNATVVRNLNTQNRQGLGKRLRKGFQERKCVLPDRWMLDVVGCQWRERKLVTF